MAEPIILTPPAEALAPSDLVARAQHARAIEAQKHPARQPDPRDDTEPKGRVVPSPSSDFVSPWG